MEAGRGEPVRSRRQGRAPQGVLLNYPCGDDEWDRAFLEGLGDALAAYDCPLLGGDTVSLPGGAPRVLSLTAIGSDAARGRRGRGARPATRLWVTGTIGDAGAGLRSRAGSTAPPTCSPPIAARRR